VLIGTLSVVNRSAGSKMLHGCKVLGLEVSVYLCVTTMSGMVTQFGIGGKIRMFHHSRVGVDRFHILRD